MKPSLILMVSLARTAPSARALPKCADPQSREPCPPREHPTGEHPAATRPGHYQRTLTVNRLQRSYLLYLPNGYDGTRAWPLVFVLHGRGGDGPSTEKTTGMSNKADLEHFIAVYPNATHVANSPSAWNAEINTALPHPPGDDDVEFLTVVMDALQHELRIDAKRIYFCGASSGAIMSYRMGAELSTRIAAIGIVSGTIGMRYAQPDGTTTVREIPKPTHAVPVIAFHGEKDAVIYYDGGGVFGDCVPVAQSIAFWVKADHCNATPATEHLQVGNLTKDIYRPCDHQGEVELFTFKNGTHEWPQLDNNDKLSATDAIWDFFAKHPFQ